MSTFDLAIVALYLLVMVAVGLAVRKKGSEGIDSYFLGNRNVPWWLLGCSGMVSNFDITGTMINTALVFVLGISGFFVEIRGGIGLFLAFMMVLMGKWNRRSRVMTFAEWMRLRFGTGWQGNLAQIIAAVGMILVTIAMVTYFSTGAGKFVADVLGIPPAFGLPGQFWAALLMIVLAMVYTITSGLYGVLVTDLFQSVLIFLAVGYLITVSMTEFVLPDVFTVSAPLTEGGFDLIETTRQAWTQVMPAWNMNFSAASEYSSFNLFGVALFFFLGRAMIDGFAGGNGYIAQRYFAAKSDQEVGWMSLLWIFLLSFRWPFIFALAIMGIVYSQTNEVISDPELVLPTVVTQMIPNGFRGLLLAALVAAAMSTFDSTVNAGAAYWVKDIYQAHINPKADEKQLLSQSRWGSIGIVVIGLFLSLAVRNINTIWGWIMLGIGVGFFVPMVVRWYWWRMNGCGFAAGAVAGTIAAVLDPLLLSGAAPIYVSFIFVSGSALIGIVAGSLLSTPTDNETLKSFYKRVRPFGFWSPIRDQFSAQAIQRVHAENKRDLVSVVLSVPWQLAMFLIWINLILRQWNEFFMTLAVFTLLSVLLYFNWYRYLGKEVAESELLRRVEAQSVTVS